MYCQFVCLHCSLSPQGINSKHIHNIQCAAKNIPLQKLWFLENLGIFSLECFWWLICHIFLQIILNFVAISSYLWPWHQAEEKMALFQLKTAFIKQKLTVLHLTACQVPAEIDTTHNYTSSTLQTAFLFSFYVKMKMQKAGFVQHG